MKTINALLMGGILAALVACGSSEQELEAARQDSIRRADSVMALEQERLAAEQAMQDSLAAVAAAADTVAVDTVAVAP